MDFCITMTLKCVVMKRSYMWCHSVVLLYRPAVVWGFFVINFQLCVRVFLYEGQAKRVWSAVECETAATWASSGERRAASTVVGRSTILTVETHSSDVSRLECTQIVPAVSVFSDWRENGLMSCLRLTTTYRLWERHSPIKISFVKKLMKLHFMSVAVAIQCRIFCIAVCCRTIYRLRYTELYVSLLFCVGVEFGLSQWARNLYRLRVFKNMWERKHL